MKEYPSHFADIKLEIDDEICSTYQRGIVKKEVLYVKSPYGGYTINWFVDYKRVAFFTAHWDEGGNQWQGCWKVFNNDIKE